MERTRKTPIKNKRYFDGKSVIVKIPIDLKRQIDEASKKSGVPMAEMFRRAIKLYLEQV